MTILSFGVCFAGNVNFISLSFRLFCFFHTLFCLWYWFFLSSCMLRDLRTVISVLRSQWKQHFHRQMVSWLRVVAVNRQSISHLNRFRAFFFLLFKVFIPKLFIVFMWWSVFLFFYWLFILSAVEWYFLEFLMSLVAILWFQTNVSSRTEEEKEKCVNKWRRCR